MLKLLASLPKPVAYVLGGGGSYGASQAGQLRALARTDLRPDFVVGTSVGSLNGTILAETPETAGDRLVFEYDGH
jgi:NTE family protein